MNCLLLAIVLSVGAEPCDDDAAIEREIASQQAEQLVRLLASKNVAPDSKAMHASVPKEYRKEDQVVVYLAIQGLLRQGPKAFDVLLEHAKDKEYCCTFESPASRVHRTVGGTCITIIQRTTLCYEQRIDFIAAQQNYVHPWNKGESLADWWARAKTEPFWKIQADVIDRQLALQESMTWAEAKTRSPYSKKIEEAVFNERRQRNVEKLKAMKALLELTHEPFVAESLEEPLGSFTWLPWPTRSFSN